MIRALKPITRLYRACDPNQSLAPGDPRYVNCDAERGANLVGDLERSLRRADPDTPEVKLFAGHRGVGKTSELLRLKAALEQPDATTGTTSFVVVYFDVGRSLDLNDLDLPDLLVATAAETIRQLRAAAIPGFSATSQLLARVWDDLTETLGGEVSLKGAGVDTGFGSLAIELKNRPGRRAQLREQIERFNTSLLEAVNDLLRAAVVGARKAGYEGVVLLVDGLDKLARRDLEGGRSNTHERLFIDRGDQLAALRAHTIYTVPISLFYSPRCAALEQTFGEVGIPIPMIRLRANRQAAATSDAPGLLKLREILDARCRAAEIDPADVFDAAETRDHLCRMSGGHPRHLLMFVQGAINALDELPITRDAAESAVRNYGNSLLREMPDEWWEKLRRFDVPQDEIPKDDDHQQMLFLLHVFEYMNGRPWYEVNPVLRTLPRFDRAG